MASSVAEEGQSQVIRVNREEPQTPSSVETWGEERDNMRGLILPTGEINWACPCLDGMATGPCGAEFRAAFTCFHFSRADERGEECLQPLRDMQACLRTHVYSPQEEQQEEEGEGEGRGRWTHVYSPQEEQQQGRTEASIGRRQREKTPLGQSCEGEGYEAQRGLESWTSTPPDQRTTEP
ncbi:mitochondrial intermembrane space import and assembly protein 40 [Clupea harengus]|uniref:Mitochondrial intermembrane space import and assembly protein 40 n=1 Tax=Clupea harengus TaxID=7950 RepID=A0A6P8FC59_CLUHA|nr:mitochondrial intermembrane space import and assembly protein 40 [Clupea harengus]